MKLKIDKKKLEEIRSNRKMSLFSETNLKMPLVTLNSDQFEWPETFLVRSAKRVDEKIIDYETGWGKKDDKGKYITTGEHNVQLTLSDGDEAQEMAYAGKNFKNLPIVSCIVKNDIPLDQFEIDRTLVKLVHPVVMLGVSWGYKWDHIKLVCDDVEF